MTAATTTVTEAQLATMKNIAGFFGGPGDARNSGYIALDGYPTAPNGILPSVNDQVIVRGRGNQWRKGIVVGHGRTRLVVATFNTTAELHMAVRVQAYARDAVMLKTTPCHRCGCYIHPVYDEADQIDVHGRQFCSNTCLYIYSSNEREFATASA